MIITKPKQTLYIGLTKDGTPKALTEKPANALAFEFESLSRSEVNIVNFELSKVHKAVNSDLISDEDKKAIIDQFLTFAKSKVIAIHNDRGLTVDNFPEDRLFFIISELHNSSLITEDDTLFLD